MGRYLPPSLASVASSFTQSLTIESGDQRMMQALASRMPRAITSSQVLPGGIVWSHHTEKPSASTDLTRSRTKSVSLCEYEMKTSDMRESQYIAALQQHRRCGMKWLSVCSITLASADS